MYYNGKLKYENNRYGSILSKKHTKEQVESQLEVLQKLKLKILKLNPSNSEINISTIKECDWCGKKYITVNPDRSVCFECLPQRLYEARFAGEIRFSAMNYEEANENAYEYIKDVDFELIDVSEEGIIQNKNHLIPKSIQFQSLIK